MIIGTTIGEKNEDPIEESKKKELGWRSKGVKFYLAKHLHQLTSPQIPYKWHLCFLHIN